MYTRGLRPMEAVGSQDGGHMRNKDRETADSCGLGDPSGLQEEGHLLSCEG